ncbi:MAG: GIY-YIG nuclease family protein [Alphaproteobacteria bacterium]|nr:GIY-YIG nuclease family protein [Alphaproteobacteria bacterium]
MKQFFVYLMASRRNGTLHAGVTSDMERRAWEHREGAVAGFTKEHGVKRLVWFQAFDDAESAIRREKQIKKWNRDWKKRLIEESNPDWHDLYPGLLGRPQGGSPPARG